MIERLRLWLVDVVSFLPLLRKRELYPVPPVLPKTRSFWIVSLLVFICSALFFCFFITYLIGRHQAYLTNAEDLGIMDQALWSALHGQLFNQTICNILGDTNCAGPAGMSRFAIHFEPLLFPIAVFYYFFPSPQSLLVLQTLIVALGAFPAFWLARLRLRNDWAGLVFACLYLCYPALQQAEVFDFHVVTLSSSFLLFFLYFLNTRKRGFLFFFALLAMACKEEIPGIVAMCGLWALFFQHRWRTGLTLVLLACLWVVVAFEVMHHISPTGAPMLASRYEDVIGNGETPLFLLSHPIQTLRMYVLEEKHLLYLRILLAPVGYLPLLAPWILILACPSIVLNLVSANPQMYSGSYQYNAEIVPVLIFASIEACVVMREVFRMLLTCLIVMRQRFQSYAFHVGMYRYRGHGWGMNQVFMHVLLTLLLASMLLSMLRFDRLRGVMPFSHGFIWSQVSPHDQLAEAFIGTIPASASVSAQSALVPHLSQRKYVYLFPYQSEHVSYILLDVTSMTYPFPSPLDYIRAVKQILLSGNYGIEMANDGYLLLKRGLPPPRFSLPVHGDVSQAQIQFPHNFCTFIQSVPAAVKHPMSVVFSSPAAHISGITMVGDDFGVAPTLSLSSGSLSLITYWRLSTNIHMPLLQVFMLTDRYGVEHLLSTDVPPLYWCQTDQWQAGSVIWMPGALFSLHGLQIPPGPVYLSMAVVPFQQPVTRIMNPELRLPFQILHAPSPLQPGKDKNVLQLMRFNLVA